jgi:hypothetical protein
MGTEAGDGEHWTVRKRVLRGGGGGWRAAGGRIQLERVQYEIVKTVVVV